MTSIPEEYPFAALEEDNLEKLVKDLNDMYRLLARAINLKPDVLARLDSSGAGIDGQTTDTAYPIGTINVNQTTDLVEVLTQHPTPQSVTWITVS